MCSDGTSFRLTSGPLHVQECLHRVQGGIRTVLLLRQVASVRKTAAAGHQQVSGMSTGLLQNRTQVPRLAQQGVHDTESASIVL